jgi:multiple sugar transport system ATP-binding protein
MPSLSIRNVVKSYGSVDILKSINIDIADSEFLVLVGPSGCGKSTLLSMIAGLDSISGGQIIIDGQVVNDLHPKDRDIAMVFQSYALYPNMTVAENIGFGLEIRGVPKAEREAAIQRVAKQLQIEPMLKRKPSQLSGGQRQRVAMGRALVRNPKIFLFDEPLSNLDAKLRVEMRTEIKKLHQRLGTTIVYVTHDQIEAMTLATRIAIMKNGVLQQLGTPKEVYETPANTFVATFIGSPSMNLVPARLEGVDGKPAVRVANDGGEPIVLPLYRPTREHERLAGQNVILGLRPEAITDGFGEHPAEALRRVSCPVEVTEPTGPDTLAVLKFGRNEVTARLKPETEAVPGQPGQFLVDMSKAVLFSPETEQRVA